MSLILDEHRQYLSDAARLAAFDRAIAATVRPGDIVLDLASGTGILGLLACRAGAARVYSIDHGSVIQVARELAAANGCGDRIRFIRGVSSRVDLPERVDVVVCDQIGHMGFEAGVFELLQDARRRFLKPGARTIPTAIRFEIAAAHNDDVRSRIDFWSSRPRGLDVSAARTIAFNTGYPTETGRDAMLSDSAVFACVPVGTETLPPIRGAASLGITRAGRLDALCAWFTAELADGVTMTNAPGSSSRINRRTVMLPIDPPPDVSAGDRVEVRMHILPEDLLVTWDVVITAPDGVERMRARHSTFRGMLIADEDLAFTDPSARPRLTPAGDARRTVLELCDGRHAIGEIERETFDRHRNLFPDAAAAAAFVAEVLTRYAC